MKKLVNIVFLILLVQTVFGQQRGQGRGEQSSITGTIDGIVIDSISGSPVEFASVELMDKSGRKLLDGSLSDEHGKFKFSTIMMIGILNLSILIGLDFSLGFYGRMHHGRNKINIIGQSHN